MSISPYQSYYLLLDAFDKTGLAMFGKDWTGHEVRAAPVDPDPLSVRAEIEKIEARLEQISLQLSDIHKTPIKELTPGERARQAKDLKALSDEQKDLRCQYAELPDVSDMSDKGSLAFSRRMDVENALKDAFKSGALSLIVAQNTRVEWEVWSAEIGFSVAFFRSLVACPNQLMNLDTAPGFVVKTEFDRWLYRFQKTNAGIETLSAFAKIEDFLRHEFAKDPDCNTPKQAFKALAKENLKDYSRDRFDLVWATVAPAERSKGGRKRKSK
ncbi:hypothetical protein [Thalassovita sp.]|uniref:hypothetical protein n=1 Tax=Thalassovita sp. TaxID=1979401 RepID=UPI002AB1F446|nr:hypothetical protein [Thalassovita sp.]